MELWGIPCRKLVLPNFSHHPQNAREGVYMPLQSTNALGTAPTPLVSRSSPERACAQREGPSCASDGPVRFVWASGYDSSDSIHRSAFCGVSKYSRTSRSSWAHQYRRTKPQTIHQRRPPGNTAVQNHRFPPVVTAGHFFQPCFSIIVAIVLSPLV